MPGFLPIAETQYGATTRMPSQPSGNCTQQRNEPCHHSGDQIARVRFSCSTKAISLRLKRPLLADRYDTTGIKTMSNAMAQPAESSVSYQLTRKNHIGGDCILKRFSQWFWSVWMIAGSGTHDALADPANHPRATNCASTMTNGCAGTARGPSTTGEHNTGLREQSSENEHSHPCKACQTWGVVCDQQKPRCSHCLDQQILCFYVAPPQKPTKRSPKSRSRHVEIVNSSPRLLAN
ncbi:hypothetical protein ASPBRDRAFT_52198 [Aspergillus brasiliensis CBS 101740]|uniref:Zn(2)-C6 fungal-type domain-containing protein n=1 Tax=Aspergillus brasiliensis (strain CBS 101740 / IMI 381727 / IBT 21946) TaxID=767769 RepID=A0A1L9UY47_ASPBC|nr:hypothetical protein ASPBRDRAFT_52198 [Aspergillus brasiliensis CBS 101740]